MDNVGREEGGRTHRPLMGLCAQSLRLPDLPESCALSPPPRHQRLRSLRISRSEIYVRLAHRAGGAKGDVNTPESGDAFHYKPLNTAPRPCARLSRPRGAMNANSSPFWFHLARPSATRNRSRSLDTGAGAGSGGPITGSAVSADDEDCIDHTSVVRDVRARGLGNTNDWPSGVGARVLANCPA